jgi:hypothetical protein
VRDIWNPENDVRAPSLTGPLLQIEGSVREAVQRLLGVIGDTYSVRGVPQMMDFADVAVRSMAAALKAQLRGGDPDWRFPLRGLEKYVDRAGAGQATRGGWTATRATRVASMMQEIPAFDGTGFVASVSVSADGAVTKAKHTPDPRRAMFAYDYFVQMNPGFDETLLNSITQAKTIPKSSIREPRLSMIRRTIPDVGAAMVLRALDQEGYKDDAHETPRASFAYPDTRLLIWAEHVIMDLREVLNEEDGKIRGEVFSLQVESPAGGKYTAESYEALLRALEPIEFSKKTATAEAEREAQRRFNERKEYFRGLKAEYLALQQAIDPRQSAAVAACDLLVAFIRHAFDVKTWQRKARGQDVSEALAGDRRTGGRRPAAPRAPHPDDFQYAEEPAAPSLGAANDESAGAGADAEGEPAEGYTFEYTVKRHDLTWIDVHEASVIREVKAHGVDGWRAFRGTDYGGTLWKIVAGPMFHALDFSREDVDDQVVVIAPRREGGGADTSPEALRVISLLDYVKYFGVPEEAVAET